MIDDKSVTGRIDDAEPSIRQCLNGYLCNYDRIKIGATTNPHVRWRRGYEGRGWLKMVLLYRSKWAGSTRSMEKRLIDYARNTNFKVRPENVLAGGDFIEDGRAEYFVYVAVA